MKRLETVLFSLIAAAGIASAENIEIYSPGFFNGAIRKDYPLFPEHLSFDSDAEELIFPDMGTFVRLGDYNFPNVRRVVLGDVDYIPSGAFSNMPMLEEIVVNGLVGHVDCEIAKECPRLRVIVFNGPVSRFGGGKHFAYDCPELDAVVFNNVVGKISTSVTEDSKLPKVRFVTNGACLKVSDNTISKETPAEDLADDSMLRTQLEDLARWQCQVLTTGNRLVKSVVPIAVDVLAVLESFGSIQAAPLREALGEFYDFDDLSRSPLEKLQLSPEYASDAMRTERFEYAHPSDSLLALSRERFNLDSIAGKGDDVSRIKNLLYWVHDNIPHDGSNGMPEGELNLRNIYDSSQRDGCGYNCRSLAIALTEALIAEGIPARYVTCESKAWDTDGDCHVITVAWSKSLGKWVWVDPSFAAYVTDENGLMLHPGEVRYRLKNGLPLVLNEDANWNHINKQTKEYYLEEYMAKNLYIMSCNMFNQANPEGPGSHSKRIYAALVPQKSNYSCTTVITTDEDWFWQAPEIE